MPQQLYYFREELYGRPEVFSYLTDLRGDRTNFTVLDIGASHNPFNRDFLTHTFDLNPSGLEGVTEFLGDINCSEDWQQIFDYVDQHGKFDFVNCTHTLEDLAYPHAALKYMPRIAKEGFIAVPSKYWELQRRDLFRGGIHHRWIFDNKDGILTAYPKINLIESLTWYPHGETIEANAYQELRMFWKENIEFRVINNDYLGPTSEAVVEMYKNIMP